MPIEEFATTGYYVVCDNDGRIPDCKGYAGDEFLDRDQAIAVAKDKGWLVADRRVLCPVCRGVKVGG